LGNSIIIGESGTTDYAGALLRFYAAEGVVQGHKVHVVGMGEVWGRELPGISEDRSDKRKEGKERAEKMKIAWRYEGLGQFESARGAFCTYTLRMQYHTWSNFDQVLDRVAQCAKDGGPR
jgi:elongator complex protein 4